MSALHTKTKKVTTYGRKKTHFIPVHEDFSNLTPVRPTTQSLLDSPNSPVPKPLSTRPPLQTKLSKDASNLGPTVESTIISGKALQTKLDKGKSKVSDGSFEDTPIKPVRRVAKSKISSLSSRVLGSPAKIKEIIDAVVITSSKKAVLRASTATVTSYQDSVDAVSKRLEQTSISTRHRSSTIHDLLESCTDSVIHPFSTVFASQSFRSLFSAVSDNVNDPNITKIGEASYSEVFLVRFDEFSEAVVKIIPLLPAISDAQSDGKDMPDRTEVGDVVREIAITKQMSKMDGGGFVQYLGSFIAQGQYPTPLLDEWSRYKSTEGSSSIKPDCFPEHQQYILLVLSNGGSDLENFKFSPQTGWLQAAGVFWQVVASLSKAESEAKFEHRDLHEGQILITAIDTVQPQPVKKTSKTNYVIPESTGVQTSIIDFGLSRLETCNGTVYTPLPEDVYEGIGEQWDVYRSMRDTLGDDWESYHSITNVMWLHYLVRRLLHSTKSLRKPKPQTVSKDRPTRRIQIPSSPVINHRKAANTLVDPRSRMGYEVLVEVEKVLAGSLGFVGKGRRGFVGVEKIESLGSAEAVLEWGRRMGWVV